MRFRFAPSPTGHLHVGGARTAILNWLLARHHGGEFILRIEDTDRERNVAAAEQVILDDLRWLGIEWDEGPDMGGPVGPYRQSEREAQHAGAAERLLESGLAYVCTCPPGEENHSEKRGRCPCAKLAWTVREPGASVRFRVPDRDVLIQDAVRGEVRFPQGSIEDFVLVRGNGRATYNFAATVDDAQMRISHVVRGADHVINTPKQVLLYEALGYPLPVFAHIPLILGSDRQKLSKRHGATSVEEFRRQGYLPEALLNYLSLLSWSSPSGDEFLPAERLIEEIDLGRVGASDAVFDIEKLRWLSSQYIQQLPLEALSERLRAFLPLERYGLSEETLPSAAEAVRKRISILSEAPGVLETFVGSLNEEQRAARSELLRDDAATRLLATIRRHLSDLPEWSGEAVNAAIRAAGKEAGTRGKALFLPLRLALTGEEHGPELWRVMHLLGRERTLERLDPEEIV